MTLVLNPENPSSIGDDTFWTWIKREILDSRFKEIQPGDTVAQYSVMGAVPDGVRGVGLLWELYPEMKRVFQSNEWDDKIARINACAASCEINCVPTELVASIYPDIETRVIPIGVDMDVFCPLDRHAMRMKHGFHDEGARIGMWCGTPHPMKGFDRIPWGKADQWIIVWKQAPRRKPAGPDGVTVREFTMVDQMRLAELMNVADFYCVSGRLRSYFLVEYEAMACDIPLLVIDGDDTKDFVAGDHPRATLRSMRWGRDQVLDEWKSVLIA